MEWKNGQYGPYYKCPQCGNSFKAGGGGGGGGRKFYSGGGNRSYGGGGNSGPKHEAIPNEKKNRWIVNQTVFNKAADLLAAGYFKVTAKEKVNDKMVKWFTFWSDKIYKHGQAEPAPTPAPAPAPAQNPPAQAPQTAENYGPPPDDQY